MSEKRKYKSYSKEFKEDAVLLVLEYGYSVSKVAKAVGIRSSLLYLWKQKYEAQQHPQKLSSNEWVRCCLTTTLLHGQEIR